MRSRTLITGLLVFSVFLFGGASTALGQEQPIIVEGQVTNGTAGGGSVAGITVTFHQESETVHEHTESVTDEEGRFQFDEIAYDPTVVFGVSVSYQGGLYGIDLDLSAGPPAPAAIVVYDAIESVDVISVQSASLLIEGYDKPTQMISALEIVVLVNTSDRAYVPGTEPMNMVRFGLPPETRGLRVDTALSGWEIIQVDLGFALMATIPPGSHDVMFAYEFPYSGTKTTIDRSYPHGAQSLRVLAPMDAMELSSEEPGKPEAVPIGENLYLLLEASDLPRGAQVSVDLEGLTEQSLGERLGESAGGIRFEFVVPIGLGGVMVLVVGYAIWRRSLRRRSVVAFDGPPSTETEGERAVLEQMLTDLESGIRTGTLSETEYQRRRAIIQTKLAALDDL